MLRSLLVSSLVCGCSAPAVQDSTALPSASNILSEQRSAEIGAMRDALISAKIVTVGAVPDRSATFESTETDSAVEGWACGFVFDPERWREVNELDAKSFAKKPKAH